MRIDDRQVGFDDRLGDLVEPFGGAGLHPGSAFRGEAAQGAFEEQQREWPLAVVVGVGLEGDDPAEHEVMVAHLEHVLDRAVDPGHRPVDDRRARRRSVPGHICVTLGLVVGLGELPAQIRLITAEHVDAERTLGLHRRPGRAVFHRQEPHQRWIERYRGERSDREADRLVPVDSRHDRDAGGEVPEHGAELLGVECVVGDLAHRPRQ